MRYRAFGLTFLATLAFAPPAADAQADEVLTADYDEDGDVDLDDFGVFVNGFCDCGGAPGGPPFAPQDFDQDGDIDSDDFGVFVDQFQRFPPAPMIPGDFDGDGDVDQDDFGVFVDSFQKSPQGGPPFAPGDFDEDGDVDFDDFGVFVPPHPGPPPHGAIPEPASLLLALFGAAALARRRVSRSP